MQVPPFRAFQKLMWVVTGCKELQPLKTFSALSFRCQVHSLLWILLCFLQKKSLLLKTVSCLMFMSMTDPMIDSYDPKDYKYSGWERVTTVETEWIILLLNDSHKAGMDQLVQWLATDWMVRGLNPDIFSVCTFVQTSSGTHLASCKVSTVSFSWW